MSYVFFKTGENSVHEGKYRTFNQCSKRFDASRPQRGSDGYAKLAAHTSRLHLHSYIEMATMRDDCAAPGDPHG